MPNNNIPNDNNSTYYPYGNEINIEPMNNNNYRPHTAHFNPNLPGSLLTEAELVISAFQRNPNSIKREDVSLLQTLIQRNPRLGDEMANSNNPRGVRAIAVLSMLAEIETILSDPNLPVYNPKTVRYRNAPHLGPKELNNIRENVLQADIYDKNTIVNLYDTKEKKWGSNFGQYYLKDNFNQIAANYQGLKRNPLTRSIIQPEHVRLYEASIPDLTRINTTLFTEGGKRRKSRKSKKTRKVRSRK